eukprot:SAG31_NODE_2323_length_5941_cov_3.155255_2_plen_97_part_00
MAADPSPYGLEIGTELLNPATFQQHLKTIASSSPNTAQHGQPAAAYRHLLLFCGARPCEISRSRTSGKRKDKLRARRALAELTNSEVRGRSGRMPQ